MCTFLADLAELEFQQLKSHQKVYLVDYGIKLNPSYREPENEDDGLRVDEMKYTIFD